MPRPPNWVNDNPFIKRLLNGFIDQCDKPNTVRFQKSINPKSAPELFNFDQVDTQYLWPLVESKLHIEHNIIERIQYKPVALSSERYEKAIIYFNRQSEDLVRNWLQRPAELPYSMQWQLVLDELPHFKTTALKQAIQVKDFSANEVLAGFTRVGHMLTSLQGDSEKISLRGLSARCFWGDSKFLDNRRGIVEEVFELAESVVVPRAIMLAAYIPPNLSELVFIENFDSFLSTVNAIKSCAQAESTAVVYSAGYGSTASVIRSLGHSQFVCINSVEDRAFKVFYQWWFQQSDLKVKTYFWGDLDYEGMRILKVLKTNFPDIQAWKLAYDLMLNYHNQGLGHSPKAANKQHQQRPVECGCRYADMELTPLLIKSERFIDQEVVSQAQLLTKLAKQY